MESLFPAEKIKSQKITTMTLNEQQVFWKDKYANDYIAKNSNFALESGIKCWAKMLMHAEKIENLLECGSNIGRNIICWSIYCHQRPSPLSK
ncbi:MAG: hypothetical protein M3Q97_11235 [Bacteroidota bacterium]|nr:hypothetical protein [Bacteroidota bacterium]